MTNEDLAFMTVRELAPLIASRQVSPVDVVEAHLSRIEAMDDVLRAYIYVDADNARAQAKAAEAEIAAGTSPIATKGDSGDRRWMNRMPTMAASPITPQRIQRPTAVEGSVSESEAL